MAKAQYGITPAFADLLLSSLNGVRTNIDTVCAQLHDDDPGPQGLNASSAFGSRQQFTFTSPGNGATSLAGGIPTWEITDTETLAAVSLWNGSDAASVCLFTLPIHPPITVLDGDTVILNGCTLTWQPQAAGIWPPTETIEAGVAQGQASALLPTLVSSSAFTIPSAQATASALVPTVLLGIIVPVPSATATASALAPSILLDWIISAPLASATASAFAPTVSPTTPVAAPVASGNAQAPAPTVSGGAVITAPVAHGSSSALAPTVSIILPVVYDATGSGSTGGGAVVTSLSWTHSATAGAYVLVAFALTTANETISSVTYGGTAMTLLGHIPYDNNSSTYGSGIFLYGLAGAPSGSKTVSVSFSASAFAAGCSVSYLNVASVGTAATVYGLSTSPSQSVTGASGAMIFNVLSNSGPSSAFSSYAGGTSRYSSGSNYAPTVIQDSASTSPTFSGTLASSNAWAGIGIVLNA